MIKPISLLFFLGLIWGSGYSIAHYAMTHGVPPLGYAFWQSWGPVILILTFLFYKKIRLPCSKQHILYYFTTGLLGIVIPNTNIYITAAHLPAGILAVIVNTVPILAYPIALALGEERFYWTRMTGVVIGMLGIFIIIFPHLNLPATKIIPWILLALISPFCFALCAIIGSKLRPINTDSLSLSAGMLLFSALLLTPIVLKTHEFYSLLSPYHLAKWVVLLEIILSSIGYILFFELLKVAGPVYYSLTGGLVALTGLFWGKILFNEPITSSIVLAVSFILTAIFLLSLKLNAYRNLAIKKN